MKKIILLSCLATSLQAYAGPVFWGVDFGKDFEPDDFKMTESSSSSFKYNLNNGDELVYDYVIKTNEPNLDYIGVVLGDNHSEGLSKRPFLVVGCSNNLSAIEMYNAVNDLYVVSGKSHVVSRVHDNKTRTFGVELVAFKFTASESISLEHKSCLAVESKRNLNYFWKSKQNSNLRTFYMSLPDKQVY